jgi:hypothetical protein
VKTYYSLYIKIKITIYSSYIENINFKTKINKNKSNRITEFEVRRGAEEVRREDRIAGLEAGFTG